MTNLSQQTINYFEGTRKRAIYRARDEDVDMVVVISANPFDLKFGLAPLYFYEKNAANPDFALLNSLYYEVWKSNGTLSHIAYNDPVKLMQLGGQYLPLFNKVDKAEDVFPANLEVNPIPLWWEVEHAEQACKFKELVALRNSLRSMLNYN